MKKIRFFFSSTVLLMATLVFVAANCKEPEPLPPTPTEQELISKEWKVDRVLINNVPDQITDYKSYRRRFDSDGSYTFKDAPGVVKKGTWKLVSNNQRLLLDMGTSEEQSILIINSISGDKLDLEFTLQSKYKTGEQKAVYELVP